MSVWEWIVSVILFIVALSVIIAIHELGHLSMAKLFNVYCQEYSIGFGPTLLKKKRKGGETYFSIRAIPLGGYVSMYGEGMKLEDGVEVPPERSIEGIKKWKKIIVVSAGVILNAVTAFVLILISNVAFQNVVPTGFASVKENGAAYNAGIRENYKLEIEHAKASEIIDGDSVSIGATQVIYSEDGVSKVATFFVVDSNVVYNDTHYVLTYFPNTSKKDNVLSECLTLYVAASRDEVNEDELLKATYTVWMEEEGSPDYYPNFKKPFIFKDNNVDVHLKFDTSIDKEKDIKSFPLTLVSKDGKLEDLGIDLKISKEWLPFDQRIKNTFSDFGDASIAVFKGIGALFTTGIKNMSGLVGIFTLSANLYGTQTFATYLYFWGLISINLAIFNLFPFPGLDGWQILVTVVEGVSRKKIPDKVKSIMSFIGLALVFALMIAVVVMDVLRIVGVM